MTRRCDLAVIGCAPGGSTAAIFGAWAGLDVVDQTRGYLNEAPTLQTSPTEARGA